jgi:hypothetical protein
LAKNEYCVRKDKVRAHVHYTAFRLVGIETADKGTHTHTHTYTHTHTHTHTHTCTQAHTLTHPSQYEYVDVTDVTVFLDQGLHR